jgi:hypothetical protein
MLAFGGTVADFTAAVEADCPLQRIWMLLALF